MISSTDDLLAHVAAEAQARHMSRSPLIALATRREINTPDATRVDLLLAHSGPWEAAHVVAEQRTVR